MTIIPRKKTTPADDKLGQETMRAAFVNETQAIISGQIWFSNKLCRRSHWALFGASREISFRTNLTNAHATIPVNAAKVPPNNWATIHNDAPGARFGFRYI